MSLGNLSGAAAVAGVIGSPVRHSLSPLIHNAWIAASGLDAAYVPFAAVANGFEEAVRGLRAASLKGLNVTLPFKAQALALANRADAAARAAGAANLLLFHADGSMEARNTDGIGLLAAFAAQAPRWRPQDGAVIVLGAGGAARGAAGALLAAGAEVLVANRTQARAQALAEALPGVRAVAMQDLSVALAGAAAIVNATSAAFGDGGGLDIPLHAAPAATVVMDMTYVPLRTPLLRQALAFGLTTVDGLAMLIGQAVPSFEALFGVPPPGAVDVRALALQALGEPAPDERGG